VRKTKHWSFTAKRQQQPRGTRLGRTHGRSRRKNSPKIIAKSSELRQARNSCSRPIHRSRCCRMEGSPPRRAPLQGAEEFVEFVGGVEVGFEFAGGEFFAEIVEAAGEKIEGGGENFLIGEDDVAPGGIGACRRGEANRGGRDRRERWEGRFRRDGRRGSRRGRPPRAAGDARPSRRRSRVAARRARADGLRFFLEFSRRRRHADRL